jgi:poly-gamma-glutamate synthase PgsB/CapB
MTSLTGAQYLAATGLLLLLIAYFAWEKVRHEHHLRAIPLRIHVNGTRGKSAVTRLIAAGLRAGGFKVLAKTTGSEAKVILSDGTEAPLARRGPANIRELIPFMRLAAHEGADAVVVECMAVRPELQRFAERRLVRSQIGVITNVRADHEEVLGAGAANVARALANTIPAAGLLVTTAAAWRLLAAAEDRPDRLMLADTALLAADCLGGFGYEVVGENVALALAVCEAAGVDRQTALAGMRAATPDFGNVAVRRLVHGDSTVTLINALAANDPESTVLLWERYVPAAGNSVTVLLNCRPDRKYRTVQLARALSGVHHGGYLVCGDAAFAARELRRAGVAADQIAVLPKFFTVADLFAGLPGTGDRLVVFAAGNVQGLKELPIWGQAGANALCR